MSGDGVGCPCDVGLFGDVLPAENTHPKKLSFRALPVYSVVLTENRPLFWSHCQRVLYFKTCFECCCWLLWKPIGIASI